MTNNTAIALNAHTSASTRENKVTDVNTTIISVPWQVPLAGEPTASVGMSKMAKIGLPNYSSAEVSVWVTVPCAVNESEVKKAIEYVNKLTSDTVKEEAIKILSKSAK